MYDLGDSPNDQNPAEWVQFAYFRGIGEHGFEYKFRAGEPIAGLGVEAIWGAPTLTVLTSENDVVAITMYTDNGDLAQAEQIFHLAAPKLRAASAPAPFTAAQLRFLSWYNGGGEVFFADVRVGLERLAGDLVPPAQAWTSVRHDAIALQSAVAKALSDPSPVDLADYKMAIMDAGGVALDALRHVPADKLFRAASTASDPMTAFDAAAQHEIAAMNGG